MSPKNNSLNNAPEKIGRTVAPRSVPPGLSYAVGNIQGVGRRERQEDSFAFGHALDQAAIEKEGLLFVVADGMGGMLDGKLASDTVIRSLVADYDGFNLKADISAQLATAISSAGVRVYERLGGDGGSTVVAAVIYDDKLYFASVGDSFAYLFRNRQLVRLNSSHNLTNEEYACTIQNGSLDPEPGRSAKQGEALTQFLGMCGQDETDYNVKPLKLKPGDVIMLCTDGVAGVLGEVCISECLSYGLPVDMCASLEEEIKRADSKYQDNYTALVVQCRTK